MHSMVGHQSATVQTITMGARENGKLTGIRHESMSATSMFGNYIEYAAKSTRPLWTTSGGISTNHKVVHANRITPTAMGCPHEALDHFALESALDELAYASGTRIIA
jgi:xanthine dehydrogenase YagR molybdenum-binding subunit